MREDRRPGMNAQHAQIRADAGLYLTSSGAVMVLDGVRNLVVAGILGPYVTGLCTTLMVLPQIGRYFDLGLIEALSVWIPQYRKTGASEQADSIRNKVWTITLLISSLGAVVAIIAGVTYAKPNPEVGIYLLAAGVLILLSKTKQFVTISYLADGSIRKASWLEFWFALMAALCSIVAVYHLQGYGFWIGLLLPSLIVTGYGLRDHVRCRGLRLVPTTLTEVSGMLPQGTVMLMASLTYTPFVIASRLFLASTVGVREVGLFLLAAIVIGKVAMIPTAIARVMLPKFSAAHDNKTDEGNIFELFLKSQVYTLCLSSLVVILGLLWLPSAVAWLLPAYRSGVPAAMILLAAGIPYCLIHNATNVLLALNQKRLYLKVIGVTLALQAVSFVYLLGSRQVSAYSVSICLFFVFSCYACFANLQVLRLGRNSPLQVG